jgi:hypothetical protein
MGDEVTVRRFSWPAWIGGLALALFFGCILNVVAGFLGMATQSKILSPLIGITPGLLFALLAFFLRNRSRGFAIGLFTGACIVALVGGICGGALSGGIDFK